MRMKRVFAAGALLLALTPNFAAAQEYYTLPEIREQAKDGWHETYTDKYGRETVVDIDVEVYGGRELHQCSRRSRRGMRFSRRSSTRARKDGTSMGKSSSGIKIRRILCSAEGAARSR